MILNYKVNMAGPYHIKKGIPCQDAYCIREISEGIVVAAVADGLGSELYSDKGAKVATSAFVTYCRENFTTEMTGDEILAMFKRAYTKAYAQVQKVAFKEGNDIYQYDCTLCTAIYDGETLYYGQSGDSGLIAQTIDGTYHKLTEQQRNEAGCVYPLCFGPEYWEFNKFDGNVTSIMIMTDGMWDHACPTLLSNTFNPINVPFVDMFMNQYGTTPSEIKQLEKSAYRFIKDIPENQLNDDKTFVVLINSCSTPSRREDEYYQPPNWEELLNDRINKLNSTES